MRRYLFAHEEDDLHNPGLRRKDADDGYEKQARTTRWWLSVLEWPVIQLRMKNGYRIEFPLYQQIMQWGTEEQKREVRAYVKTQPGGGFGADSVVEDTWQETVSKTATKLSGEVTSSLTDQDKPITIKAPPSSTDIVEEPAIPGELYYTVQPGDILIEVGERSGLYSTDFFRFNKQILARHGKELYPGEILRFPPHSKIGVPKQETQANSISTAQNSKGMAAADNLWLSPVNPDYVEPTASPLLNEWEMEMEGDAEVEVLPDVVNEEYAYTEEAVTITTNEQLLRWKKMKLPQILHELQDGYTLEQARIEFTKINYVKQDRLDQWIKTSIISYGWRPGKTPPVLNVSTVSYMSDGTAIIESPTANEAFNIAVKQIMLKEFQSYYWKDRATGKTNLKTIYYGSKEVVYNKRHVDQSLRKEWIEKLYHASGSLTLYQNALAEKNTGEAFVLLVKSAQEVLFYDKSETSCDGMLGPETVY
ncbi:MAG: hypothetical protein IM638_17140 [Bacteroidetes bacterium]|nr:hypothetical protein [Bacteroidota bacterium]